jgi:hypothetical protein
MTWLHCWKQALQQTWRLMLRVLQSLLVLQLLLQVRWLAYFQLAQVHC